MVMHFSMVTILIVKTVFFMFDLILTVYVFVFFLSKVQVQLELILGTVGDFHSVSYPAGVEERSQRLVSPFQIHKERHSVPYEAENAEEP